MVDDIELASQATHALEEKDPDHPYHEERDQEWIDDFRRL